jgi:hypothetical protein
LEEQGEDAVAEEVVLVALVVGVEGDTGEVGRGNEGMAAWTCRMLDDLRL